MGRSWVVAIFDEDTKIQRKKQSRCCEPYNAPFPFLVRPSGVLEIGIGIVWFVTGNHGVIDMAKALARKNAAQPTWVITLIGFIFSFIGLVFFYFLTVSPLLSVMSAKSWRETPCTILRSEVKSHGDTYSVDVEYVYEIDGRTYNGTRFNFLTGSSSGTERKQRMADKYPVGSQAFCYVNPDDPTDAVLNLELTAGYAIGCFGLIFMFVGMIVSFTLRRRTERVPVVPEKVEAPRYDKDAEVVGESITYSTHTRPRSRFIGMLIFTLIWNGIVGGFTYNRFFTEGGASWDGVATVFTCLFQLVGFALIAGTVYSFLAMFNPRLWLTVNPAAIRLGGSTEITWTFDGDTNRIKEFRVELEGKEKATYRRGTDTTTDTHVFREIVIVSTTDPAAIRSGTTIFTMPEFTMHTFRAVRNEILWTMKVRGSIDKWPDVSEEFETNILPMAIAAPVAHVEGETDASH